MHPVAPALRRWFVLHPVADIAVAVPLFIARRTTLVAAALFGIGVQSLLGRDEPRAVIEAMLDLEVIGSSVAAVGIGISALQGAPAMAWVLMAVLAIIAAVGWRHGWALRSEP